MSRNRQKNFFAAGWMAAACVFGAGLASAEDMSASDIVRDLAPTITRSLSSNQAQPAPPPADEAFIGGLRGRNGALSGTEVARLDDMISDRKQKDFEMEFKFNSNALTGKALKTAEKLGEALANPRLQGQTFLIIGHTDAKGSDAANQKLSESRAAAVVDLLVKKYNIPADRLVSVGYGETHLKNAKAPFAAENRRVQVVNVAAQKAAQN